MGSSRNNFKFQGVHLLGQEMAFPDLKMTTKEMEDILSPLYERLNLPYGRLEMITGIKERYIGWDDPPSKLAIKAASELIEKNKINPSKIDLLIYASVCRDFLEPATASVVHAGLNLSPETQFFDLSNACLGVMSGFILAGQLISTKQYKNILVVGSENSGPLVRATLQKLNKDTNLTRKTIKKYIASLTIGSGAYAGLISDEMNGPEILGGSFLADTTQNHLCQGGGDLNGMMMETDSEKLLHAGIKVAKLNFDSFISHMGEEFRNPHHFITHQVGPTHEDLLYKTLEIDKNKAFSTFSYWGNTGSVALPLTLAKGDKDGLFKEGEILSLLGIGSGLSSIMLGVKWN